MKFILVVAFFGVAAFVQGSPAPGDVKAVQASLTLIEAALISSDPTTAAEIHADNQALNPVASIPNFVSSQFEAEKITPQVFWQSPTRLLSVSWASGAAAELGNLLYLSDVDSIPSYVIPECDPTDSTVQYTIVACDLDPLGHNKELSAVQYHVIGNIQNCDLSTATTVTNWLHPTALYCVDPHRYVFFAFKSTGAVTFEEPTIPGSSFAGRLFWCPKTFATKYNLQLHAANYINLQWDCRFNTNVGLIDPASFSPFVVAAMGRAQCPAAPACP